MIADTMVTEAFDGAHPAIGPITVSGFLVSFALSRACPLGPERQKHRRALLPPGIGPARQTVPDVLGRSERPDRPVPGSPPAEVSAACR